MFNPDVEATPEQNTILKEIFEIIDRTPNLIAEEDKPRWRELADRLAEATPGFYGHDFYCRPWHIMLHGNKIMTSIQVDPSFVQQFNASTLRCLLLYTLPESIEAFRETLQKQLPVATAADEKSHAEAQAWDDWRDSLVRDKQ